MTGSGVGTFVFAPIASALVQWAGWRGCNRVGCYFHVHFVFLFCFMHCIDKYDIYLHSSRKSSRFNVKVMAGICSLGLICGLALAPKAKKHTRFF